jgi:hypothetical protein
VAKGKSVHVIPALDGGWTVKNAGSSRAFKHFEKKEDAETFGRTQSIKGRSDLVIHRPDGTIAAKTSHGNDPHVSRDRKK